MLPPRKAVSRCACHRTPKSDASSHWCSARAPKLSHLSAGLDSSSGGPGGTTDHQPLNSTNFHFFGNSARLPWLQGMNGTDNGKKIKNQNHGLTKTNDCKQTILAKRIR